MYPYAYPPHQPQHQHAPPMSYEAIMVAGAAAAAARNAAGASTAAYYPPIPVPQNQYMYTSNSSSSSSSSGPYGVVVPSTYPAHSPYAPMQHAFVMPTAGVAYNGGYMNVPPPHLQPLPAPFTPHPHPSHHHQHQQQQQQQQQRHYPSSSTAPPHQSQVKKTGGAAVQQQQQQGQAGALRQQKQQSQKAPNNQGNKKGSLLQGTTEVGTMSSSPSATATVAAASTTTESISTTSEQQLHPHPQPQPPGPRFTPIPGAPKTAAEGTLSCTTCDRGFDTPRDANAHMAAHVRCSFPGCTFAALKKITAEHARTAHKPGAGGGNKKGSSFASASSGKQKGIGNEKNDDDEKSTTLKNSSVDAATSHDDAEKEGKGEEEEANEEEYPQGEGHRLNGGQGGGVSSSAAASVVIPSSLLELIPLKYRDTAHTIGDSAEDIAKWRAERRKHYPTHNMVQQKREREEDRKVRGQWSAQPDTGKMHRPSLSDDRSTRRGNPRGTTTITGAHVDDLSPPHSSSSTIDASVRSSIHDNDDYTINKNDDEDDKDDDDDGPPEELPTGALALRDALLKDLTHLVGAADIEGLVVGQDKGLEMTAPQGISENGAGRGSSSSSSSSTSGDSRPVCKWYTMGKCRAGARCVNSHAGNGGGNGRNNNNNNNNNKNRNSAGINNNSKPPPSSKTLLRKLLSTDIQRETSMILQCVRYIVKNNFFSEKRAPLAAVEQTVNEAKTDTQASSSISTDAPKIEELTN